MRLRAGLRALRGHDRDREAYQANTDTLLLRFQDVVYRTWYLGFTAFGGPSVHFRIFHQSFVEGQGKTPWIDEQVVGTTSSQTTDYQSECCTDFVG
jgi:hypothetical protein